MTSLCRQDTNWIILRPLHTSSITFKDESMAEKTVKVLKELAKPKPAEGVETPPATAPIDQPIKTPLKTAAPAAAVVDKPTPDTSEPPVIVSPSALSTEPQTTTVATGAKKSITQKVVDVLKHYYHGFRLLFVDVGVSTRYVWRLLQGKTLTRRERRQVSYSYICCFLFGFITFIR